MDDSENDQKFHPTTTKRPLTLENKWNTPTGLLFQKGMVNSHIAIRFFRNKKILKTIVSEKEKTWVGQEENIWKLIYEFGGQSPDNARCQREITLTAILHTYLNVIGYMAADQPQLNGTTPDILATRGPYSCFIELKAYFGKTIVGEAEVAQLIKYYNIVHSNSEIMNKFGVNSALPPKFMLITSGQLPAMKNNSLFNGELNSLTEDKQIEFIKQKYQNIIKKMGYSRYLEGRDTRNIYKFAWQKYKKQIKYKHNIPPQVEFIDHPRRLDHMIENQQGVDVILVPANVFSRILWLSNLKKERFFFERLCKSWLSQLILDKSLIDYSGTL